MRQAGAGRFCKLGFRQPSEARFTLRKTEILYAYCNIPVSMSSTVMEGRVIVTIAQTPEQTEARIQSALASGDFRI